MVMILKMSIFCRKLCKVCFLNYYKQYCLTFEHRRMGMIFNFFLSYSIEEIQNELKLQKKEYPAVE